MVNGEGSDGLQRILTIGRSVWEANEHRDGLRRRVPRTEQAAYDQGAPREFREMLDTYIAAGRKVGGTRRRRRGFSPVADVDPKAVRAWAAAKGYEVSNRGRIPAAVVEAYRAAGNSAVPADGA